MGSSKHPLVAAKQSNSIFHPRPYKYRSDGILYGEEFPSTPLMDAVENLFSSVSSLESFEFAMLLSLIRRPVECGCYHIRLQIITHHK